MLPMACQVELMPSRSGVPDDVAAIDVTLTSSLVTQDVMTLCERLGLRFVVRDDAIQVWLPSDPSLREVLYASLDRRRIEYTLPLFGG